MLVIERNLLALKCVRERNKGKGRQFAAILKKGLQELAFFIKVKAKT